MSEASLANWPSLLPAAPLLAALQEEGKSLAKVVTTGNKSMLVRKLASRTQRRFSAAFNMTAAQVEAFETFFHDTLDGGVARFNFTHPRTGEAIEVSFDPSQSTAYTLTPQGSMEYFKVSAKFIIWT